MDGRYAPGHYNLAVLLSEQGQARSPALIHTLQRRTQHLMLRMPATEAACLSRGCTHFAFSPM